MGFPPWSAKERKQQTKFQIGGVSNTDEHATQATGAACRNSAGDSRVIWLNTNKQIGIRQSQWWNRIIRRTRCRRAVATEKWRRLL